MLDSVLDIITLAFGSVFDWFTTLLDSVGMFDVFLGAFFILVASRFLLMPLFKGGFGGSDKAKKSSSKDE